MTIPEKPLEFGFAVSEMPLEASAIFDQDEWEDNPMGVANKMRKFLIKNSTSWTRAEISALTIGDLSEIITQVGEAIKRLSVPKAS